MSYPTMKKRMATLAPIASLFITFGASSAYAATAAAALAAPPNKEALEEIVVSSPFKERKLSETILGTRILNKKELAQQINGTIGETLSRQAGISSSFFGPGASRPIIRGLGGDRIRVLDMGIGSIDASSTSPDHAVSIEPALAERIEILRGSAMLQYGSSAAGGVVNIIDGRIPTDLPENGIEGAARYGYSTVDNGHEVAGGIDLRLTERGDTGAVLHLDGAWRDSEDYDIPGFAESFILREMEEHEAEEAGEELDHEHDEEGEAFGKVENSAVESYSGSVGLGWIFEDGFLGANLKYFDSKYGVPGGHGHGEEEEEHHDEDEDEIGDFHDEEEEENVRIDLEQWRFDVAGEMGVELGPIERIKLRFGYADYEHLELEGDEVGTLFSNEGWEGRLEFAENWGNNWQGATGIQYRDREFSAVGEEAFVPPSDMMQLGIFSFKEYKEGQFHVDLGARYEYTDYDTANDIPNKDFNSFSFSAGAGYQVNDEFSVGVNVSRTERAPSAEELFSNGPHLATNAFELGDTDLDKETAYGGEISLLYSSDPVVFRVNAYWTHYRNFIYETPTGDIEDGLDVFAFQADNANFKGFEAEFNSHVMTFDTGVFGSVDMHFDAQADYVIAELTDSVEGDRDLPRIPPFRALVGTELTNESWEVRTELQYVDSQDRISAFELPTDDYLMWNAYLTVRPFESKNIALDIRAMNLGDVDARTHASFLKDVAPLPGRNFRFAVRFDF